MKISLRCIWEGNVESLQQVDYKKQEKLEVGDDLSSLPEHVAGEYMDIEKAPVVMSLKDANAVGLSEMRIRCIR